MDNNTIANIRLAAQQLSSTNFTTPKEIVAWLGAVQAQDFNMAKWAVGIRLPESCIKSIEEAFDKGEILRTHVLRPTWHFVAPQDIRWMLALSAPRIKASSKSRDRDLEITEALYTKTNRIIEKALAGNGMLTREELSSVLEKSGIAVDTSRMIHFMMRAELDGVVCSGVLKEKKHTYALLDERVTKTKSLNKEEALATLAGIYFSSHGPATLQDFVWWSGLTVAEAKQGLEAVRKKFVCEKTGMQEYWLSNDFSSVSSKKESLFLLPAFDEYIIAYRDRTAVLPATHHVKAISSNGIFRPTIVHNGQVSGLWKKSASKKNPVETDYFEPAGKQVKKLTKKAIAAFCKFHTS